MAACPEELTLPVAQDRLISHVPLSGLVPAGSRTQASALVITGSPGLFLHDYTPHNLVSPGPCSLPWAERTAPLLSRPPWPYCFSRVMGLAHCRILVAISVTHFTPVGILGWFSISHLPMLSAGLPDGVSRSRVVWHAVVLPVLCNMCSFLKPQLPESCESPRM